MLSGASLPSLFAFIPESSDIIQLRHEVMRPLWHAAAFHPGACWSVWSMPETEDDGDKGRDKTEIRLKAYDSNFRHTCCREAPDMETYCSLIGAADGYAHGKTQSAKESEHEEEPSLQAQSIRLLSSAVDGLHSTKPYASGTVLHMHFPVNLQLACVLVNGKPYELVACAVPALAQERELSLVLQDAVPVAAEPRQVLASDAATIDDEVARSAARRLVCDCNNNNTALSPGLGVECGAPRWAAGLCDIKLETFHDKNWHALKTNVSHPPGLHREERFWVEAPETELKMPMHERFIPKDFVCLSCGSTSTPMRRPGPDGPATLCNACGLRWRVQQRKLREKGKR